MLYHTDKKEIANNNNNNNNNKNHTQRWHDRHNSIGSTKFYKVLQSSTNFFEDFEEGFVLG